jgi:hypothetical protein
MDIKRLPAVLLSLAAGGTILVSTVAPLAFADSLLRVAQIVIAVGLMLGALSVLWNHGAAIARGARGWFYSLTVVATAVIVFGLEFAPPTAGLATEAQIQELSAYVLRYVYEPLATSLLGLLTFFALRASWRALRARPGEAILILGVAVVFLVADGPWAAIWPDLQNGLEWVRAYPVQGVARGLLLGASVAALIATVRVILGFDLPYLDR